jgi:hypothetical protein
MFVGKKELESFTGRKRPAAQARFLGRIGMTFARRFDGSIEHGKIVETAKQLIVEWSDELRAVVDRLKKAGARHSPNLNLQPRRETLYRKRVPLELAPFDPKSCGERRDHRAIYLPRPAGEERQRCYRSRGRD